MSHHLVALMLRTGIPVTVWLEQADGVIETATALLLEQDDTDRQDGDSDGGGPQMSG
jgi:hypothetical protein